MIDNRNYRYQWLDAYGGVVDNQIITPYFMAEKMVNEIPSAILRNPKSKYLDIMTKSGVYLVALYNKLMPLLADVIPDRGMRAFHILHEQLYGLTESLESKILASEMLFERGYVFRNIVYIERYSDKIVDNNGLIKREIERKFGADMKFDVILGNPPYQSGTGGGGTMEMAMPLYNYFVEKAIAMETSLVSMIIPSRWMSGGKSVLDEFRRNMVEGRHIKSIHNYERASDVFSGPDIAGGVQFFTYSKDYNGPVEFHNCGTKEDNTVVRDMACYTYRNAYDKEQYMIIADNTSAVIADSVRKFGEARMDKTVMQIRPFGLDAKFNDSLQETPETPIRVVCGNSRETWTSMDNITQNKHLVRKWKVCVGKVTCEHGGNISKTGDMNVLSKPFILKPGDVCSMTYLVIGIFNVEQEALNMLAYIKTRLARFLISVALSGMNMTGRNFMFVPVQDYSKPWTDVELYEKYNLTQEQIEYIESRIKVME